MIDEQKLRELCSNATPGPWSYSDEAKIATVASISHYRVGPDHGSPEMACYDHHAPDEIDAAFIAAANPATILALLDELATMRQERTAWRVTAEIAEAELEIGNEMNDQLREQNTAVDEACAKLEAEADRLSRDVPATWEHAQAAAYITICEALESSGFGLLSRNPTAEQVASVVSGLRDALAASPQPQPVQEGDATDSVNETNAVLASRYFDLLKVVESYEAHGVTCQTFRHFVDQPCDECNCTTQPVQAAQPMADEEKIECECCCGKGWNWEERQVAERESDVQTLKIHCDKCEGTGHELV